MKNVTRENYRADKLYSRVVRAVYELLQLSNVIVPADVFVKMGLLTPEALLDWRHSRSPCLERVIRVNLAGASRILRILSFHAQDLNLKPSHTAYMKWGKGPRRPLRFSKFGDRNLEAAYSRHFVRLPGKQGDPTSSRDYAYTPELRLPMGTQSSREDIHPGS